MDDLQFLQNNLDQKKKGSGLFCSNSSIFPGNAYEAINQEDLFMGMVARSSLMKKVVKKIKKISMVDSTILVTGPSGSGKELVSKAIHSVSGRKFNKFVSVNCGAIPENLLESELFGHKRGSFTGAIRDKIGRFQLAQGGSLFLDEIGDMPLSLQIKLLRVMQNKVLQPVGGLEEIPIDVRIISATHRDLQSLVDDKKFREDLFYRLNVIPLPVPSLAQRPEDIVPLVDLFLSRLKKDNFGEGITFSHDAMECLLEYSWPGNIRELENLIERLFILRSGSKVGIQDLPSNLARGITGSERNRGSSLVIPEEGINLKRHLEKIENDLICQALKMTAGNKNQAAKLLKLNRTTLIEKMKKKKIFIEDILL